MLLVRVGMVLVGAFVGLVAAFVLDLGAEPCQDLFMNVMTACALPQPSAGGMVVGTALGAAVPLLAFLYDKRRG